MFVVVYQRVRFVSIRNFEQTVAIKTVNKDKDTQWLFEGVKTSETSFELSIESDEGGEVGQGMGERAF